MKTVNTEVKKLLKEFRTAPQVWNEIQETEAIKKAYVHFLTVYQDPQLYSDNHLEVEANLLIVKQTLGQLYVELDAIKVQIKKVVMPVQSSIYTASPLEERAIMLFNSDKRFTITE